MSKRFIDDLRFKNGQIKALSLTLIGYKSEGGFALYSPALDLYAHGENEEEAFEAFDETIFLYLDCVLSENTLEKDLKKLGWKKHTYFKHRFKPPQYDPRQIMSQKGVNSFNVIDKQLAYA